MQHIRICNILRQMPTHAIEVMTSPTAWLPSDNMATWLAQSDDFVDAYRAYTHKTGVNFEGVKTAASLGNLKILKCAFEINAVQSYARKEKMVIVAIVGAARTTNIRTVLWLDIERHLLVLSKIADTPMVVRDTALSTRNEYFIDTCLKPFRGCHKLLYNVHDFEALMQMRAISRAHLFKFPVGGITSDEHMNLCEILTLNELRDLFADCAVQALISHNMRFARYFVDRCELEYPKLRIPWIKAKFVPVECIINLLRGRDRLQADCVSCTFYNVFNNRRGYRGDFILKYDELRELLRAGFKWHRKLKRIVKRLYPHNSELRKSDILELFDTKNKYQG